MLAVERAEYVLLSNTTSLYSAVLDGAAIRDAGRFTERVLGVIRAILAGTGRVPDEHANTVEVQFAKSLGRSVTGSMNELITHVLSFLADGDLHVADVGVRLNDILLSALAVGANKYGRPREAFAALVAGAGS